jgi:hypothetical protein
VTIWCGSCRTREALQFVTDRSPLLDLHAGENHAVRLGPDVRADALLSLIGLGLIALGFFVG